jgi:hypothetical protein
MRNLVAILLTVLSALSLGACASTSPTNELAAADATRHAVADCAITEWSGKCPY